MVLSGVQRDLTKICMAPYFKNKIEGNANIFSIKILSSRHGGLIPWDDDLDICVKEQVYLLLEVLLMFSNKKIRDDCYEHFAKFWHKA